MTVAGLALQRAVYEALVADLELAARLGGAKIYDVVPRKASPPYIAIGQSTERDWSTGSEEGREHILTLHAWSTEPGHAETHELLGQMRRILHEQVLDLEGHRLVNLRHEFSEARREAGGTSYRGLCRFRAVTEPID